MRERTRRTGIEIIGDVAWGTHFCLFYQTKEDLLDILIPYFKAGLEQNEFCMWVTSEPLGAEDAKTALKRVVPDLDEYLDRGHIEILDYTEWYLKSGAFDANQALEGWVAKESEALKRGFGGLRLTGNTFWLEEADWRDFTDYEEVVDGVIQDHRMIALCTYALEKCGSSEIMDVVSNHEFALVKRKGRWESVKSTQLSYAEDALRESEQRYRQLFEGISDAVLVYSSQGRFLDCNEATLRRLGYSREEFLRLSAADLVHPDFRELMKSNQKRIWAGETTTVESAHLAKDGRLIPVEVSARRIEYQGEPAVLAVVRDITERKRAMEALRQRERELSIRSRIDLIFLTLPDDAMYGEVLQVILEATQSKHGVFGYINEDGSWVAPSLTRDIWEQCQVADKDIIFPRQTWGGIWGRALIEGKTLWSNEPGHVPGGHVPVLRSMVVPITHNDEVIGGITLANKATDYDEQDIKLVEDMADFIAPVLHAKLQRASEERQRKRAEEELELHRQQLEKLVEARTVQLREANELLEQIFSTTHFSIAYMDSDFNFIRVNPAYAAADGREPGFFVGKNHFVLFPHEENESIFRHVVETGQPYTAYAKPFKYVDRPERGVTYWDWTLRPVKDTSGKVQALILGLVNVTESVKAQETLRESEENFRALAENANDAIVIATITGELAYVNKRSAEISGYGVAKLLEMNLNDLMHPDELQKVTGRLQKRLAGESAPPTYETVIVNNSGETVPVEITAARTVWHGQPTDIILVRDITERKQNQAALIQTEKLAIAGRLAASLAHEINNPLQTVIGCLGLAAETLAVGGDASRYLHVGREELQRAARIVAQLRDLQRRSEPEEREPTDVGGLLERVLTLSRKQCEEHRVEVVWRPAEDLPPLILVPDRMQQVFLNLVLNALDAMPQGGQLQISATLCSERKEVCVSFTDSGLGIAPDVLARIFDPFYSTKPDGLGLGLFISQNIVEEHGGCIEVESRLGEGTTFAVWLPT